MENNYPLQSCVCDGSQGGLLQVRATKTMCQKSIDGSQSGLSQRNRTVLEGAS